MYMCLKNHTNPKLYMKSLLAKTDNSIFIYFQKSRFFIVHSK